MKFQNISLGFTFNYEGFYANFEMPFYLIFENVYVCAFITGGDGKGELKLSAL